MAKRREEEAPKGSPAWMATFSDLMNLLLCFFVLLFSMSSIDEAKYEELVVSLSNSFSIFSGGGSSIGEGTLISNGVSQLNELDDYYSDMGKASDEDETNEDPLEQYKQQLQQDQKKLTETLYDEISEMVGQKKINDKVSLGMDSHYQYVKISLNGAILFESGQADFLPSARPVLSKVGDILSLYSDSQIKIEGHTDAIPINSAKYANNLELSTARASSVWKYFVNEKNLAPETLEAAGKGEYSPVATNNTAEGRAKNRRVEIKIYTDTE